MDPASEAPASVAFGRFRVLPHRCELLADGLPVELGGRAFDVLIAPIEARGKALSRKTAVGRRVARRRRFILKYSLIILKYGPARPKR